MLDVLEKVTHTETNLQLKAASLFKYVWPFSGHQAAKGWGRQNEYSKKKKKMCIGLS